jgi:hypothetical protein
LGFAAAFGLDFLAAFFAFFFGALFLTADFFFFFAATTFLPFLFGFLVFDFAFFARFAIINLPIFATDPGISRNRASQAELNPLR